MNAATATLLTQATIAQALQRPRKPLPLRVAMLAQRPDVHDDPTPTEVMVYRQPASDVPVPSSWRSPASAPGEIPAAPDEEDPTAGEPPDTSASATPTAAHVSPAWQRPAPASRVAAWIAGGAITAGLVGSVLLGMTVEPEMADMQVAIMRTIGPR